MKLGRLRGEFEDPSPVPVQWSLSLFRFDGPASRTMAVFLGFVGRVWLKERHSRNGRRSAAMAEPTRAQSGRGRVIDAAVGTQSGGGGGGRGRRRVCCVCVGGRAPSITEKRRWFAGRRRRRRRRQSECASWRDVIESDASAPWGTDERPSQPAAASLSENDALKSAPCDWHTPKTNKQAKSLCPLASRPCASFYFCFFFGFVLDGDAAPQNAPALRSMRVKCYRVLVKSAAALAELT